MDKYLIMYLFCVAFCSLEGKLSRKQNEDEQLVVAFNCGHPNVYFSNGVWEKDNGSDCPKKNNEILAFCKHVYPNVDIVNIMEVEEVKVIPGWCQEVDASCMDSFSGITPYRCLTEKFQNEALLVPEPCIFDHLHDSSHCSSARKWAEMAGKSCKERGFFLHEHSMLKPCGLNRFSGVEFVCCPSSFNDSSKPSTRTETTSKPVVREEKVDEETKHVEETSRAKIVEAYVNREDWNGNKDWTWMEHDFYLKAKKDLARHHKFRVTKMINDWNAARVRAMQLEEINKKEGEKLKKQITERFQKLYEAEEVENEMEKKQLSDLHQQRVTSDLNDRKQKALDRYLAAIDEPVTKYMDILEALKHFIKILHKDRLHTVNRFKHLMNTDPAKAESIRETSANHISGLDRQLDEALSVLDRVPKLNEKIRHQVASHLDSYHSVDASVFVVIEEEKKTTPQEIDHRVKPEMPDGDDYVLDLSDERGYSAEDEDYVKVSDEGKHKQFFPIDDGKDADKGFLKLDYDAVKKLKYGHQVDLEGEAKVEDSENIFLNSTEDDINVAKNNSRLKTIERTKQQIFEKIRRKLKIEEDVDSIANNNNMSSDEDEERSEDMREMEDINSIDGDIYDRHFFNSPDHIHKNELSLEQLPRYGKHASSPITGPNFGAAIPLGVAVGTLTVAVVIAIGVLVMRRRGGSGGLYHNPPIDGTPGPNNSSPEERHMANMQMNGYENPTYKYFERYQQNPTTA